VIVKYTESYVEQNLKTHRTIPKIFIIFNLSINYVKLNYYLDIAPIYSEIHEIYLNLDLIRNVYLK